MFEINELVSAMNNYIPEKTSGKYYSIAKKYLDLCVSEMLTGYGRDRHSSDDADTVKIYIEQNIRQMHTHRYNKTQYWYTWLSSQFPLWIKVRNGYNNGKSNPTIVRSLVSLRELVDYRISESQGYLLTPVTDSNHDVPLDSDSIINYIVHKQKIITSGRAHNLAKEASKLNDALRVLEYINQHGTSMAHRYDTKPNGRRYCTGFNLQNFSSEVREAALGNCLKLDLNTAMLVFYRTVLRELDPGYPAHGLTALIDDKNLVRKQLASLITNTKMRHEDKIKYLVKRGIAAIGFGSKPSSGYGALPDIIYNRDDRQRFIDSEYVQMLQADIEHFNAVTSQVYTKEYVKEHYPDALKAGVNGNRFSRNAFNSYLYQGIESIIMDWFMAEVDKQYPGMMLLHVHDCIYVKPHVSLDFLRGIQWKMQQRFGASWTFDREKIEAYSHVADIQHSHKQHIQAEELKAQQYQSKFVDTQPITVATFGLAKQPDLDAEWTAYMDAMAPDSNY